MFLEATMTSILPVLPTAHDAELARRLSSRFDREITPDVSVQELPNSVVTLVHQILAEMAQGNAVSLSSVPKELTTQQAATVLGVSRPFIIKLIDEGELAYRRVGSHRRITLEEVMAYQERTKVKRFAALEALVEDAQKLGMGY
jgi:excisionase family DNA binding protein